MENYIIENESLAIPAILPQNSSRIYCASSSQDHDKSSTKCNTNEFLDTLSDISLNTIEVNNNTSTDTIKEIVDTDNWSHQDEIHNACLSSSVQLVNNDSTCIHHDQSQTVLYNDLSLIQDNNQVLNYNNTLKETENSQEINLINQNIHINKVFYCSLDENINLNQCMLFPNFDENSNNIKTWNNNPLTDFPEYNQYQESNINSNIGVTNDGICVLPNYLDPLNGCYYHNENILNNNFDQNGLEVMDFTNNTDISCETSTNINESAHSQVNSWTLPSMSLNQLLELLSNKDMQQAIVKLQPKFSEVLLLNANNKFNKDDKNVSDKSSDLESQDNQKQTLNDNNTKNTILNQNSLDLSKTDSKSATKMDNKPCPTEHLNLSKYQYVMSALAEYDMIELKVRCNGFNGNKEIVRILGIHGGITLYNLHRCIAYSLLIDEAIAEEYLHAWILNDGTVYGGGTSCSTAMTRRLSLQTDRHTTFRQIVQLPLDSNGNSVISKCASLIYVFGKLQCSVAVSNVLQGMTSSADLLWVPRCCDGSFGNAPKVDNWLDVSALSKHKPNHTIDINSINLLLMSTRFSKNVAFSRRTQRKRMSAVDDIILDCYKKDICEFFKERGLIHRLTSHVFSLGSKRSNRQIDTYELMGNKNNHWSKNYQDENRNINGKNGIYQNNLQSQRKSKRNKSIITKRENYIDDLSTNASYLTADMKSEYGYERDGSDSYNDQYSDADECIIGEKKRRVSLHRKGSKNNNSSSNDTWKYYEDYLTNHDSDNIEIGLLKNKNVSNHNSRTKSYRSRGLSGVLNALVDEERINIDLNDKDVCMYDDDEKSKFNKIDHVNLDEIDLIDLEINDYKDIYHGSLSHEQILSCDNFDINGLSGIDNLDKVAKNIVENQYRKTVEQDVTSLIECLMP